MKILREWSLILLVSCCFASPVFGQTAEASPGGSPAAVSEASSAGGRRPREFQGDDLGQVLRLLARQAKINLLVDEGIKGTINVRFENASAMEAVEAIARQCKLTMTKDEKGFYYLAPPDATDSTLDLLAKPETASRLAAYVHNFYEALMKEGFSSEEALQIATTDPATMVSALGKKPDAAPAK